jgi:hypothetical protein
VDRVWLRLVLLGAVTFPAAVVAQRVSFGFVGGTHLTRDFPISRTIFAGQDGWEGPAAFDLFSDARSFLCGLSVEVGVAKGFSLEADALRRNLHLQQRFIYPGGSPVDNGQLTVSTWEWPVLAKYRLPLPGAARPFLQAGPSFRTRHNPGPTEPSQFGVTVGTGLELPFGRVRFSPALRYTRWRYDGDYPRVATKRDQIELVAGVSYATSVSSWRLGNRKLHFGLLAGAPLTGGIAALQPPERIDEEQGYIAGLAAELELNRRFAVELNGLYRPLRARQYSLFEAPGIAPVEVGFEFTVLTWQFPVLAKYRFRPEARLRPVIAAGPSLRLAGNLNGYNPSRLGLTASGGLEHRSGSRKISPMLRYTRWSRDSVGHVFFLGPRTAPNQVELLISVTF